MTLNRYHVTLRHDSGRIRITVCASRVSVAVRLVLAYELAPYRAITAIEKESIL